MLEPSLVMFYTNTGSFPYNLYCFHEQFYLHNSVQKSYQAYYLFPKSKYSLYPIELWMYNGHYFYEAYTLMVTRLTSNMHLYSSRMTLITIKQCLYRLPSTYNKILFLVMITTEQWIINFLNTFIRSMNH